MLERLLPRQIDNDYHGRRAALWLLGLYIAIKLAMSLNSIFNAAKVASGADGFRLESYGVDDDQAVLMLFALVALGQLALASVGIIALLRYRAMVPLVFLLLLAEAVARRCIVAAYELERSASVALPVNLALITVLGVGFALSLWRRETR